MTIQQYETLRNRIDGILGSQAPAKLKNRRLTSVLDDLLTRFGLVDKFSRKLYEEVSMELNTL